MIKYLRITDMLSLCRYIYIKVGNMLYWLSPTLAVVAGM